MRKLTRGELAACIAADAETRPVKTCGMGAEALRRGWGFPWEVRRISCRTRFCKWLTLDAKGDVTVHTVAVLRTRKGEWLAKEVVRARAGGARVHVRDLAFHQMSGYCVDWSGEGAGRSCGWNDGVRGRWLSDPYNGKSKLWRIMCEVLNPEVLEQSEKFKYCAWNGRCGDILEYLKLYQERPRVEFLPKAGLSWLARSRGFVARLEANAELRRFVSKNLEPIKRMESGPQEIADAFKRGCTLEEARERSHARVHVGRRVMCELGRSADPLRVWRYLEGQKGANAWEYGRYLGMVRSEGLDLRDTKVSYPRDLHRAMADASRRDEAREWRKNADARRELERALAARVEAFGGVAEMVDSGLLAHFPRREREFVREGKKLDHCVGINGYAGKMASGESVIVMVRAADRPDQPFVTAEIDASTGRVLQCYGKHNSTPPKHVLEFVREKVAPAVKRAARKAKRGVAA